MNALAKQEQALAGAIEQVLVSGNLAPLTAPQRVDYYNRVCQSVGLNPLTRPFDYLQLNGKLILYARRDAADQLRAIHGVSLSKPHIEYTDDLVVVTIDAADKYGRTDADFGAVSIANLKGEAKANAIMKAITKAKRRVTLSIVGLGWLDETEVDTIPGAQRVVVAETGEIIDAPQPKQQAAPPEPPADYHADEVFGSNEPQWTPPTSEETAILSVWQSSQDAYTWAVNTGACVNAYEAENSMKKVARDNNMRFTATNKAAIFLATLRHWQEKIQAQPEAVA